MILLIGAISFATQGLNFGIDFESGTKIKAALVKDASVDDVRNSLADAGVADPNAVKMQSVTKPQFGDNVVQIQGTIDPGEVGKIQDQLRRDFGLQTNAKRQPGGLRQHLDRAHLRRPGGAQRRLRDHLLAAPDQRLRGLPIRGQVRDPGDDRGHPRHPHNGRRVLALGTGRSRAQPSRPS